MHRQDTISREREKQTRTTAADDTPLWRGVDLPPGEIGEVGEVGEAAEVMRSVAAIILRLSTLNSKLKLRLGNVDVRTVRGGGVVMGRLVSSTFSVVVEVGV